MWKPYAYRKALYGNKMLWVSLKFPYNILFSDGSGFIKYHSVLFIG